MRDLRLVKIYDIPAPGAIFDLCFFTVDTHHKENFFPAGAITIAPFGM